MTLTDKQIVARLRKACAGGMRAYCRNHGLDHGNVSKILSGERGMSPQVASALGYERVVRWGRMG